MKDHPLTFALITAAVLVTGGCPSDESRARKAWSSAIELTDLDALDREAAIADRLGAEVVEELGRRNYGKARSKAVELGGATTALHGYWLPLARAKLKVAHAYKFLAMREDARAVTEIEQAAALLRDVSANQGRKATETRAVEIADFLAPLPAEIANGRNVVRYRLEEAATKIGALLAAGDAESKASVP